ncbi:MAG: hypothetical protein EOO71_02330 [Myxococcaceae bacterium]|nr:MAG: hypothetical protein EOO71_02330 [Myxococcaceae bacterium]
MKKTLRLMTLPALCLAFLPACGGMEAEGLEESDLGQTESSLSVSGSTRAMIAHGGSGGTAGSIACAAGYVAVGIYGRAGSLVDRLGLICAALNTDGSLGYQYNSGTAGGTGGYDYSLQCPAGQAVVGFHGRSADKVDRLGVYCSGVVNWRNTGTIQFTSGTAGGSGGSAFSDVASAAYVVTSVQTRAATVVDQIRGITSYINP